jgi:DNA-directed RNA polymerase omega subunit
MFRTPDDLRSKYEFVTLASLRAEQLQAGSVPRVEPRGRKPTVIAQEEVAAGLVAPWDPSSTDPSAGGEASSEQEPGE